MKRMNALVSVACLAPVLACGAADPDPGEPVPLACGYQGQTIADGAEFQTPDGCVTYLCDDGALAPIVDGRITIAGDLDLPSQAEVDAQVCLGVVEGSLTISGTAADLTGLRQLARVGGTLDVTAADVVTLDGLQQLGEIGGDLVIASNPQLTTLAFQPFMSVFGDVTIDDNDALASLAGAAFIGQCSTCAGVGDTEFRAGEGADLQPAGDEGGEPGGSFYGNIVITNNDVLADLSALGNLVYAWADVRLRNNGALASLAALVLVEVQGDLEISQHASLDTAAAESFAAGVDVWGATTVCGNQGGVACE